MTDVDRHNSTLYHEGEKVACLYPTIGSDHRDVTTWTWRQAQVVEVTSPASTRVPVIVYRLLVDVPAVGGDKVVAWQACANTLQPWRDDLPEMEEPA